MIYKSIGPPILICDLPDDETLELFRERGKVDGYDRAVFHSLMDAKTFFLWEIVATPFEIIRYPFDKLSDHYLYVGFDKNGQAINNGNRTSNRINKDESNCFKFQ